MPVANSLIQLVQFPVRVSFSRLALSCCGRDENSDAPGVAFMKKSTTPRGKTGMNLICMFHERWLGASNHSFTGADLRWKSSTVDSLKHSFPLALPQQAHSLY